ncbi:MAG: hypothetical protein ACLP9S_13565 [Syntrophales bacterium]|jgi:uncharacterized protein YmfQ (DUF2313 family)
MNAISKHLVGVLREGTKENVPDTRTEDVLVDGRLLKPDDIIRDLVDVIDDNTGAGTKHDREIIVIDGRVYERVSKQGDEVHDLVDPVEKNSSRYLHDPGLNDEIVRRVSEIAEKIAKEMVPEIAERVIREEINKLKR